MEQSEMKGRCIDWFISVPLCATCFENFPDFLVEPFGVEHVQDHCLRLEFASYRLWSVVVSDEAC